MSARRALLLLAVLALVVLVARVAGPRIEGLVNRTHTAALPEVSEAARALHASSFVVDLHADSLLFGRDLLERSDLGHVDLPRLREGGVGLQVFAVPTVVPYGQNMERNEGDALDMLTLGGLVFRPRLGLASPTERALLLADQLAAYAEADDRLMIVRTRRDLARLRERRAADPEVVGALLAIEGAHAMESEPENLERLFAAGYRMLGLTHFFDNAYAGSAHGVDRGSVSPLGLRTLDRMDELGMLHDVAHLSPAGVDTLLGRVKRPVVFSHGGVKGACDNVRNLSDAHVRRIADQGGVVGIGYWEWATCGTTPAEVVRAIQHVIALVGDENVGLGSDYDGGTSVAFDTSQLVLLTQAMLDAGLPERSIRRVLGENALRAIEQGLPD
jgi:microsomal dipeptidase-like Zn-dependent dipeptidase